MLCGRRYILILPCGFWKLAHKLNGGYSVPELLELGNTFFKSYIYLYTGMCIEVRAQLLEVGSLFHPVGPGDGTQLIVIGDWIC